MDRILLLEDDLSLINGLTYVFERQGFALDVARSIAMAREMFDARAYDLLVLDVALPDGSGFDFCRRVRSGSQVPIIFLTALDEETSIVMGLDIGGDDYITKPFKLGVLVSRVNALLRRARAFSAQGAVLESGGIRVELAKGQVFRRGELLELTAAEYRLLCFFMQHPGQVLSREQILGRLWDCEGSFIDGSALTVYIRRLSVKIEDDPGAPRLLVTVRAMGYKWNGAGV